MKINSLSIVSSSPKTLLVVLQSDSHCARSACSNVSEKSFVKNRPTAWLDWQGCELPKWRKGTLFVWVKKFLLVFRHVDDYWMTLWRCSRASFKFVFNWSACFLLTRARLNERGEDGQLVTGWLNAVSMPPQCIGLRTAGCDANTAL